MNRLFIHQAATLAAMFLTTSALAVPWVSRHGMTAATYQTEFDTWTASPYSYRLISVSGYEQSGEARFAAVWEKRSGPGWITHPQLTAADFASFKTTYAAQNFHPVFISGFGVGSSAYYNVIWEYLPGADIVARAGMSYSTYVSENTTRVAEGYKPVFIWTFNAGATEYFCAIWRKGVAEGYAVRVRRSASDYQGVFEDLGGQGYQLLAVSTAQVSGQDLYTSVWKKPGDGVAWSSHHALTAANYQGDTWNAYYQGFRPVFASAFGTGSGLRFNAIYHHNGGMNPAHLQTIDESIAQYMTANSVPGLSLAIAREGRLLYAKGFGLADKSAGEWVHPHHRFRIASISKPITATAVLKLREEGGFSDLDQKVFGTGALLGTDFGTLAYGTAEKAISLRHLLQHTTGWTSDGQLWNNAYGTDHAAIIGWQLDNANPSSTPGNAYQYMNLDFVTAGRVIEKHSGQTYERYVKDHVLAPCCVTEMEIGGQTLAERKPGEVVYYGAAPYVGISPRRMDANGGWIARPMDLLLFLRRINSDSAQPDILSAASMTAMRTGSMANSGYGLGAILSSTWWGHNGGMDGTISFMVQRNDGLQFAFTCNTNPVADGLGWNLRAVVDGLVSTLDAANAWPDYDLFPCANPAYDQWLQSRFPRAILNQLQLQADVWGPGADLDGDGLPNAVEAYFDLDPLRRSRVPFSFGLDRGDFVVRWTRPLGDRGVELRSRYAATVNPRSWTAGPAIENTRAVVPIGDIMEETRLPAGTRPQQFQRLDVIVK